MAELIAPRMTNLKPKQDEVVLMSSDKRNFIVKRQRIIKHSGMLSNLLEDLPNAAEVPLPNVDGTVLAKVLKFVNKHCETETKDGEELPKNTEEDLKAWDLEYVKAANYLDSKELQELTMTTVANMIKGKDVDGIYKVFGISKEDITPEDEEQVRKENPWAFE